MSSTSELPDASALPATGSNVPESSLDRERALLREINQRPFFGRLAGYVSLSGPGWLQSALTLGGGSLTGSLYLGVLAGFSLLWLQPLAMILGIIMLSAIGYVTLSSGERPFEAINRHVNPVLGWGWLLASLLANMVWCLPQYSLATGVIQQNLLPDLLGSGPADFQHKLVIVGSIFVLTTAITWSYGSGHWGVRVYEWTLKGIVGLIVLSFMGVVVRMAISDKGIDWAQLAGGFVPDFGSLFRPAAGFVPYLEQITPGYRDYWSNFIVDKQRDVVMTAFATAVGINMTFLLPYSMLGRGWSREHRALSIFDLSTGMFIPFVVATSCVVIAAANQFYTVPQPGLAEEIPAVVGVDEPTGKQVSEFQNMITGRIRWEFNQETAETGAAWTPEERDAEFQKVLAPRISLVTPAEQRLVATLVTRDAQALSASLAPLTGRAIADYVFGFGVLGMALSSISLLMLISGFIVCEVMHVPPTGWPLRLGALIAATGALGPFFWSKAAVWMAIPTSVFGLVLLPIAYVTFFLLINQKSLLGEEIPRGWKRWGGNVLMAVACLVALLASGWAVWAKTRYYGLAAVAAFFGLALIVHFIRPPQKLPTSSSE